MHSQYPVWFFVHKLIVLLWSLNYFYSINLKKYLCKNLLYYYMQTWKWFFCCNKSIFEQCGCHVGYSVGGFWTSRIDPTTPVRISGVTLDSVAFVTPCYSPTKAIQAFLLSCFSLRDHCVYSSDSFFSWNELLRFSLLYRSLMSRSNLLS